MRWLLLAPCVLAVWLVWWTFLAIILRPWVRLPLLAFWNKQETAAVLRQLKPRGYILLVGFQWSWACFFGTTLFDYVSNRYFGGRVPRLSLPETLESLLILVSRRDLVRLDDEEFVTRDSTVQETRFAAPLITQS
jgi:hypothetical protein